MASWLKVAEDLLEVVDRRAKIVATELSDEQSTSQPSGPNNQEVQAKKGKPREKGPLKLTNADGGNKISAQKEKRSRQRPRERMKIEKIRPSPPADSSSVDTSASEPEVTPIDVKEVGNEGTLEKGEKGTDGLKTDGSGIVNTMVEVQLMQKNSDNATLDGVTHTNSEIAVESYFSVLDAKSESSSSNQTSEIGSVINLEERDSTVAVIQDTNASELPNTEAQGLLKSAVKTGQSKEARLARVCAGLSSRLQEYKSENAQLEELLVQEREKSTLHEAHIKQLQQELSMSRVEGSRAELNMVDALTAKNAEIESLVKSLDSWKKRAATSEEKLASLESCTCDALVFGVRAADQSSSRVLELEHKLAVLEVECASLQQELQEMEARNRRVQKKPSEEANQVLQMQAWQEEVERARQSQREAEAKISSLEAELQKMRVEMAGMRRDAEHYSRQEHVELEKRYRELTDLLVCNEPVRFFCVLGTLALRANLILYGSFFQYHKQTQLESMASEKAALEFQLEKSLKQFHEVQIEAERSKATRRSASSWEEDADIKALELLSDYKSAFATPGVRAFVLDALVKPPSGLRVQRRNISHGGSGQREPAIAHSLCALLVDSGIPH
ncbi:Golgin-84 [Zea mays]|uniref:Golgin-84 n=1 Tax=Zea mays TaxID=4577 RepID=A0A3L6DTI1_MAIZE|nr:Golgin-84 [Zea mays]